jgi:hypothetical protein
MNPRRLGWITVLPDRAIKDLMQGSALRLSLFNRRDVASITSPDVPTKRLIVCRNLDRVTKGADKRQEPSDATERDLARIPPTVARKRNSLRGATQTALAFGAVMEMHKMRTHFDLITAEGNVSLTQGHRHR